MKGMQYPGGKEQQKGVDIKEGIDKNKQTNK